MYDFVKFVVGKVKVIYDISSVEFLIFIVDDVVVKNLIFFVFFFVLLF